MFYQKMVWSTMHDQHFGAVQKERFVTVTHDSNQRDYIKQVKCEQ